MSLMLESQPATQSWDEARTLVASSTGRIRPSPSALAKGAAFKARMRVLRAEGEAKRTAARIAFLEKKNRKQRQDLKAAKAELADSQDQMTVMTVEVARRGAEINRLGQQHTALLLRVGDRPGAESAADALAVFSSRSDALLRQCAKELDASRALVRQQKEDMLSQDDRIVALQDECELLEQRLHQAGFSVQTQESQASFSRYRARKTTSSMLAFSSGRSQTTVSPLAKSDDGKKGLALQLEQALEDARNQNAQWAKERLELQTAASEARRAMASTAEKHLALTEELATLRAVEEDLRAQLKEGAVEIGRLRTRVEQDEALARSVAQSHASERSSLLLRLHALEGSQRPPSPSDPKSDDILGSPSTQTQAARALHHVPRRLAMDTFADSLLAQGHSCRSPVMRGERPDLFLGSSPPALFATTSLDNYRWARDYARQHTELDGTNLFERSRGRMRQVLADFAPTSEPAPFLALVNDACMEIIDLRHTVKTRTAALERSDRSAQRLRVALDVEKNRVGAATQALIDARVALGHGSAGNSAQGHALPGLDSQSSDLDPPPTPESLDGRPTAATTWRCGEMQIVQHHRVPAPTPKRLLGLPF